MSSAEIRFRLPRPLLVLLSMGSVACASAPPPDGPSTVTSAPSASPSARPSVDASAEEKSACGKKTFETLDSMTCLVAVQKRRWAGDEAGARSLLEHGCAEGDLDACHELRGAALAAGDRKRADELAGTVAKACEALGEKGKSLAVCLRGRTSDLLKVEGVPAEISVDLALELRAKQGPKLLAHRDLASHGCAQRIDFDSPSSWKALTFASTPVANDPSIIDAAVTCEGGDTSALDAKAMKAGEGFSSTMVARSLRDATLSEVKTLQVAAGVDNGRVGVWCPSHLVDDDRAADVFADVAFGEKKATLVATVRLDAPCVKTRSLDAKRADRAFVEKLYRTPKVAIESALEKLAKRCDGDPKTFDKARSPLVGDPLETDPAIFGYQARCVYAFRAFDFDSKKPITRPSAFSSSTEMVRAGGHTVKVTEVKEVPKRLELSFRLRDAELSVEVARP